MKIRLFNRIKNILKKPVLFIFFLFLTASFFRIFFLDLIEFKFDEAFNVYQLTQFYNSPFIAYHSGISSSGMHNFPLLHYLLISLGLFSRDPQYLSFLIALINTLLVSTFYLIIRKFYGNFTAIFSSLLLASSPWAILYSRKIWHPDLILLFLIPAFYLILQAILNKKGKHDFILFLILSLLIQQHFSGFYFIFATIIIFKILKISFNYKQAFWGFLFGLIPAIPYLSYNFSSNPFCLDCVAYFEYQKQARFFDFNNFIRPLQIINGLYFENALEKDYPLFIKMFPFIKILNYVFILESFIAILGAVFILKFQRQYLFLILYVTIVSLIYFLTKTPARMYYFVILLPLIILVFVLFFRFIFLSTRNNFLKAIIVSLLILFIIFNFLFEFYFYKFLSFKRTIYGNYGVIFAETKEYVEKQTQDYFLLPYYSELKSFTYVFSDPLIIHFKLGEFLAQKGQVDLAIGEFKKAIEINQKDISSRANLVSLLIATRRFEEADKELKILSKKDTNVLIKLKKILEESRNN